jgi:hypothetical protein
MLVTVLSFRRTEIGLGNGSPPLSLGGLALLVAVRHDARKTAVGAVEEIILLDRATSRLADAARSANLLQLRRIEQSS